jgi:hypothetical protein
VLGGPQAGGSLGKGLGNRAAGDSIGAAPTADATDDLLGYLFGN